MLQTVLEIGMGIVVLVWVIIVIGFGIHERLVRRNGEKDVHCLKQGEDENGDQNKIA